MVGPLGVLISDERVRKKGRRPMWRSGGNTRLLRKRSRVQFPHSANICVHEHVCLYWVWVFLCIICMYIQNKNVYKLSRIHNTNLISAYF
jgi:hypothetical protein